MKGETRKIYRALLAFYKSTIILMVRWSFERAGFRSTATRFALWHERDSTSDRKRQGATPHAEKLLVMYGKMSGLVETE
jgi:hypothetical protein